MFLGLTRWYVVEMRELRDTTQDFGFHQQKLGNQQIIQWLYSISQQMSTVISICTQSKISTSIYIVFRLSCAQSLFSEQQLFTHICIEYIYIYAYMFIYTFTHLCYGHGSKHSYLGFRVRVLTKIPGNWVPAVMGSPSQLGDKFVSLTSLYPD